MMYKVGISFSGYVEVEVEANNEFEASDNAESLFEEMDDREIVANITSISTDIW